MSKHLKLINKILSGTSDASIGFQDICNLLIALGFEVRIRGSHHLFRHEKYSEKINIQRDGSHAKPYQVKQVRNILLRNKLGGTTNEI
jgi:predicted RNA binding protein YcfA (HicA-like mRNA interferase family)